MTEDEEEVGCAQAGDAGVQGATGDAGGDAGDGTAGPKPSKRWKLLVRSNFPRRSQPYENNLRPCDTIDFVWLPEGQRLLRGEGFKVRRGVGHLEIAGP